MALLFKYIAAYLIASVISVVTNNYRIINIIKFIYISPNITSIIKF